MTSKALLQNAYLYPETLREDSVCSDTTLRGREASVYDSVQGRLNAAGFIPKQTIISSTRDTASSSTIAAPPEAVLFRRKNAPTRYVESDIYFANERELHTELPESDLLKALHCYTSDFYSHATVDSGVRDYRSMDETALIALGILMEENVRDILGQTGDLVFTDGEEVRVSHSKIRAASSKSTRVLPSKKRRRLLENQDGSNDNDSSMR